METRLFISDLKPATAASKNIGGYVWLDFKQGDDTVSLMMPARMEAVSTMIAEAFNAHMNGGEITRRAQGVLVDDQNSASEKRIAFPTGGGYSSDEFGNLFLGREGDGDHAIILDDIARTAIEQADIP